MARDSGRRRVSASGARTRAVRVNRDCGRKAVRLRPGTDIAHPVGRRTRCGRTEPGHMQDYFSFWLA